MVLLTNPITNRHLSSKVLKQHTQRYILVLFCCRSQTLASSSSLCLAGATLRTPLCVCLSVYSSSISILTRFWVSFFIPCSNCVQMDTNVDTFTNNKIILTYLFYSFFSMHFFIYSMPIGVVSCFFATIHEI